MSGQLALEKRLWGKVDFRSVLSAGSRFSERYIDRLAGAVPGAVIGSLLLALAIHFLPSAVRQQFEAGQVFSSLSNVQRLDLRGAWMDEQLARAFGAGLLRDDVIWQEYRVIPFPVGGVQLVCAPDRGPIGTGFIFPDQGGLNTVMPRDRQIAFEILLLCSIRV